MPVHHLDVGVVVEKRKLNSPWADHEWRPVAVLPGIPAVAPWTRIGEEDGNESWYAGPAQIIFHSGETAHYRDNLTSDRPAIWIALREDADGRWQVAGITVDPYEGEAFVDNLTDRVEPVPMPHEVAVELAAFFDAHHVEQTFYKRRRDRQDLDSMGTRGMHHRGGRGRAASDGDEE
jgi:Protein of unknown function (DUF3305)